MITGEIFAKCGIYYNPTMNCSHDADTVAF